MKPEHRDDDGPQAVDIEVNAPPAAALLVDFEAIAVDLADVEIALARLDAGTYWSDEVTGAPLPDELLAASPTTRRLPDA